MSDAGHTLRDRLEAFLMATEDDSTSVETLTATFGDDTLDALAELRDSYEGRGVMLHVEDGRVSLRTVPSASGLVRRIREGVYRNPSSAVLDTVALVALYGPLTRSEIEAARGVRMSPGVLEKAIEMDLVVPGPRRDTPGRPMTWMATDRIHEVFRIDRATMSTFDADRRSV